MKNEILTNIISKNSYNKHYIKNTFLNTLKKFNIITHTHSENFVNKIKSSLKTYFTALKTDSRKKAFRPRLEKKI